MKLIGGGFLPLTCLGWLAATVAGFSFLHSQGSTPAKIPKTRSEWPAGSSLVLAKDRPTVVAFFHPQCSCSKSTLAALQEFASSIHLPVHIYAVFTIPKDVSKDWGRTANFEYAKSIPSVETIVDTDDLETKRFSASISGQILVFSRDGRQTFSGGITPVRGEAWTSHERTAFEDSLLRNATFQKTPVFGCALL